jgi:16S rRNA (cytosine1402-N4)-methyltransferase
LGVDKDPQAIEVARQLKEGDDRFDFEHDSFARLPHQLRRLGIGAVDGILLDLGVSSPQLDEAERGFSFSQDGPLDMRMDTTRGQTAAEWLASASHGDIASVLREYGEERHAGRIASAILRALEAGPINTTGQLAQIVSEANPSWEKHKHPATRAFQGIRIWINRELVDLELLLDEVVDLLRPGGRLVIISFHSLEDRMVKRFIRRMSRGEQPPRGVPVMESQVEKKLAAVGKAIKPSAQEIAANPRSRSAVMRVAERLPGLAA